MDSKLIQEIETQIKYLSKLYSDANNNCIVTIDELLEEILNSKFCLEKAVDALKEEL